jgi:hypothetical protein
MVQRINTSSPEVKFLYTHGCLFQDGIAHCARMKSVKVKFKHGMIGVMLTIKLTSS